MTKRAEILRAVSEAATVFADSPSGARTSFDIIGAVAARNIPLLFRPLDKLWGAFITVNDEERGIIVTTKLGLPVQRFTLAHELGHLLLGHQTSLDKTIGFAGRNAPASRPPQEAAADTFASELLAPKRLLLASAKRQGWTRDKLHEPGNIYQLSLRLGISYQAACWALVTSDVLTRQRSRPTPGHIRQGSEACPGADRIDHEFLGGRVGAHGGRQRDVPRSRVRRSVRGPCSGPRLCRLRLASRRREVRRPRSSTSDRRISTMRTARDPGGWCTSGFGRQACINSSSNTSGRGAAPFWHASRSTSTGTEKNVTVGRAAPSAKSWNKSHERHHPSRLSPPARSRPRSGWPSDLPRACVHHSARACPRIDDGSVARVPSLFRFGKRQHTRGCRLLERVPCTSRSRTADRDGLPVSRGRTTAGMGTARGSGTLSTTKHLRGAQSGCGRSAAGRRPRSRSGNLHDGRLLLSRTAVDHVPDRSDSRTSCGSSRRNRYNVHDAQLPHPQ